MIFLLCPLGVFLLSVDPPVNLSCDDINKRIGTLVSLS